MDRKTQEDATIIRFASRNDFLHLCSSPIAWAIATKYVKEAEPLAKTHPKTILYRLKKLCKDMKEVKKVVDYNTARRLVLAVLNPSRRTKKKRTPINTLRSVSN